MVAWRHKEDDGAHCACPHCVCAWQPRHVMTMVRRRVDRTSWITKHMTQDFVFFLNDATQLPSRIYTSTKSTVTLT